MPTGLSDLSVIGNSDHDQLTVEFGRQHAGGPVALRAGAHTELVVSGKRQKVEAALHALWGDQEVAIDTLLVSLVPVVGPGGQFLPGDPTRWTGKGNYDISKDELTIIADAGASGGQVQAADHSSDADSRGGVEDPRCRVA